MALEDLLGGLYQFNMGLPLQYANPYFNFLGGQAGNVAGLGNAYQGNMGGIGQQAVGQAGSLGQGAMGLYGNLANTQAGMYQSELPMQMEMQKYNSLAPALSGLLNQFGGFGGGGLNISPISMQFNRPDVMAGYQGAVDNSFNQMNSAADKAYGQAGNAYNQALGATNQVGNQMASQWGELQKKVFGGGQPAGPTPRPPTQNQAPPGAIPFHPPANPQPPQNSMPTDMRYRGMQPSWPGSAPPGGANDRLSYQAFGRR
jgi:hypothetical protein